MLNQAYVFVLPGNLSRNRLLIQDFSELSDMRSMAIPKNKHAQRDADLLTYMNSRIGEPSSAMIKALAIQMVQALHTLLRIYRSQQLLDACTIIDDRLGFQARKRR